MSRWDRRIERAAELAAQYPEASELLNLYGLIANFQKQFAEIKLPREALLELLRRNAPEPLASHPPEEFIDRVLTQSLWGQGFRPAAGLPPGDTRTCPCCHEKPLVAVLRPEGEGAKRSLLCSQCFTEWDYGRLLCPNCGEDKEAQLPVFTAEQFPHVRLDACDTCRMYVKSIDLTRNGLAVPEVDEIASLALDLWAAERGYAKVQPNLFGL